MKIELNILTSGILYRLKYKLYIKVSVDKGLGGVGVTTTQGWISCSPLKSLYKLGFFFGSNIITVQWWML